MAIVSLRVDNYFKENFKIIIIIGDQQLIIFNNGGNIRL